jgi:hypothetical protein
VKSQDVAEQKPCSVWGPHGTPESSLRNGSGTSRTSVPSGRAVSTSAPGAGRVQADRRAGGRHTGPAPARAGRDHERQAGQSGCSASSRPPDRGDRRGRLPGTPRRDRRACVDLNPSRLVVVCCRVRAHAIAPFVGVHWARRSDHVSQKIARGWRAVDVGLFGRGVAIRPGQSCTPEAHCR